jgi:hypothetical protein
MSSIFVYLSVTLAVESEILNWLKLNNLKFEDDQITILCSHDDILTFKLKFGHLDNKYVNFTYDNIVV